MHGKLYHNFAYCNQPLHLSILMLSGVSVATDSPLLLLHKLWYQSQITKLFCLQLTNRADEFVFLFTLRPPQMKV